jgi:hypothetical protein
MRVRVFAGLLGIVAIAGCSELEGPTGPRVPGGGPASTVQHFSGTLPLKGSVFYSFSVETSGISTLTLVDAKENGVATEALITIGLGTPRGTQCAASNVLSVTSSGTPQVNGQTDRGVHCAVVFDPGNLTTDATFLLIITHPK